MNSERYIPKIGDRISCKIHTYLTHIWLDLPRPTEKRCSGIIVKEMYNAIFVIKTDDNKLFACSVGYTYKPT